MERKCEERERVFLFFFSESLTGDLVEVDVEVVENSLFSLWFFAPSLPSFFSSSFKPLLLPAPSPAVPRNGASLPRWEARASPLRSGLVAAPREGVVARECKLDSLRD